MPVTTSDAEMASVTENPDSVAISGSIRAMVAANTGSVDSNWTPMAAHCEPCPENSHTGPWSSRPAAGWYGISSSAISRSAAVSSGKLPAVTEVLTGRCARRRASV